MRCPRCAGCLWYEREPFSSYLEQWCLNCGWRAHPLSEFIEVPMRQFGLCLCGRESLRNSGGNCGRCHGEKVSEGMRRKVSVAL